MEKSGLWRHGCGKGSRGHYMTESLKKASACLKTSARGGVLLRVRIFPAEKILGLRPVGLQSPSEAHSRSLPLNSFKHALGLGATYECSLLQERALLRCFSVFRER